MRLTTLNERQHENGTRLKCCTGEQKKTETKNELERKWTIFARDDGIKINHSLYCIATQLWSVGIIVFFFSSFRQSNLHSPLVCPSEFVCVVCGRGEPNEMTDETKEQRKGTTRIRLRRDLSAFNSIRSVQQSVRNTKTRHNLCTPNHILFRTTEAN